MEANTNFKYYCVIDKQKYYVTYVLSDSNEKIHYYTMKDGETLLDAPPPTGMITPRWDGVDWKETGKRVITPEDLEQLRDATLQAVNSAAQQAIYDGVTVETSEGIKKFGLTEVDQINISTMFSQLQSALKGEPSTINPAVGVPYHADGEICKFWSANDFAKIAQAATEYVFYHQTYCNHLRQYIKGINDYDVLSAIKYGAELPPELALNLSQLLGA